jgi:pimeloyl-ACP methyl ester carboxylesterase
MPTRTAPVIYLLTILTAVSLLPVPARCQAVSEEIVYSKTMDSVVNGGVIFTPAGDMAKNIVIIWVHGWGTNFYAPAYVRIGREVARLGYTFISANTRMHDIGNVAAWRNGKRVRGGGVWGVAGEEVVDISGWMDFAAERGFKKAVLAGHSAGWAAVRQYQADRQDGRIAGIILASGTVHPPDKSPPVDSFLVVQARAMMAAGKGDDLVKDTTRPFPSFTSAATIMDIVNTPTNMLDFFGVRAKTTNPGITRIHCPLLAFYGTAGDVGNEKDLAVMEAAIRRQPAGPASVKTAMIQGADHMYKRKEAAVANVIVQWLASIQR